jgi:hypothetical protein
MRMKVIKNEKWTSAEVSGETVEIPVGWHVAPLGSLFEIVGGGTPSTDIPWVGPKDMADCRSRDIAVGTRFLTEDGARTLGRKKVPVGSVVISTRAPVGYANIACRDMFTNQGCHSLLPSANMSRLFAYFWVKFNQETLNRHSTGTTFKELSGGKLKWLDFVSPERGSQEQIGALLAQQETVVSNMTALVEKLETRLRYFSEELLSGRLRVKEVDGKPVLYKNDAWKEVEVNGEAIQFPADWHTAPNRAIFTLKKGKKPVENRVGIPSPYLTVDSLRNVSFNAAATNGLLVDAKSILVIWDGANSGEIFRTPVAGYVSSTMGAILPLPECSMTGDFLFRALTLQEHQMRGRVQGTDVLHLDGNHFYELQTSYPSEIVEQNLVTGILARLELEVAWQKSLREMEAKRFRWLLENLMTGKYLLEEETT